MKVKGPGARFGRILGAFQGSDRWRALARAPQIASCGVGSGRSVLDGRDLRVLGRGVGAGRAAGVLVVGLEGR
jgi:hypothetical protein